MGTFTTALLWIAGLMAVAPGVMKVSMLDKMKGDPKMAWIEREGVFKVRLAGFAELAAALAFFGTALGIGFLASGTLAGIAAIGMVGMMVLAVQVHKPHGEPILPLMVIGAVNLLLAVLLFTG